MRKFIMRCLGVVTAIVVAQLALAGVQAGVYQDCSPCDEISACDPCEEVSSCDPCDAVCGTKKKSKFFVNGYLEAGFFANEYGNTNYYYDTGTNRHLTYPGNTPDLQNVALTGGQLNQLYISAGKAVDGKRGWDFGGTVDFTFGTDAISVQSEGLEINNGHNGQGWGTGDYYSAFAQAYFEAEYKKWNFKAGKFYAPFGSNGYKSTDRFFYSLADTYAFVPATAGGAYVTYSVNKNLAVYGGWVQPDQIGRTSDNNAVLFGANVQLGKRLSLAYTGAIGKNKDEVYLGAGYDRNVEYFVNSIVATYKYKKWTNIVDWSLRNINNKTYSSYSYETRQSDYGINNELIYQYNSKWAFGVRTGWTHGGYATEDTNVPYYNAYDVDKYTFSVGANWTPAKWLLVKPELRYDRYEHLNPYENKGGDWKKDQISGGVSAIVKF